jgi:GNAT superfamily N-acetyltransferase
MQRQGKNMHLRPANENDLHIIQRLYDKAYPEPVPQAGQVIKNAHVRIAENAAGEVVGFRTLWSTNAVWVAVVADHRRNGVGRLLLEDTLAQAADQGLSELTSRVYALNNAGMAFCERFKFKPFVHAVNLSLDLTGWDESSLLPQLVKARESGIRFLTFADIGDTPENRHRLYALNKTLSATIPRDQPQEFVSYETYVERRLSNKTMPHDGIFIALDGDEWVGMTQISLEESYAFNQMTGVLPDYRGRGIAQALKLLLIRFVQRHKHSLIHTFNDVGNQPMITVNENAGFRRGEQFYLVRRKPVLDAE